MEFDDTRYSQSTHDPHPTYQGYDDYIKWSNILGTIRSNKKLKLIAVLAGILFLTIAIVLLIVLLPLITKLYNYISQNGLQGILDGITGFLDKIWNGSAK